jgi:hypothetical protein
LRTLARSTARRRGRLQPLAAQALLAGLCAPLTVQAGELRFSPGWREVPGSVQLSEPAATDIVVQCKTVSRTVDGPAGLVATVVAAPHRKNWDNKMHLTVRRQDGNTSLPTCYVYAWGKPKPPKNAYRGCNCFD